MTAAQLLELIAQGEGAHVEFKSSFQKEAIETLAAFANAQGGAVLLGVSDAGKVAGVTLHAETIQGWVNQCKQITSPRIIPDVDLVALDDKTVAAISVGEYTRRRRAVLQGRHPAAGLSTTAFAPCKIQGC